MVFGSSSAGAVASGAAGASGVGWFSCGALAFFPPEQEENVIAQHSIHRDAIIVILLIYVGY
jgi:hypothetical protein